MNNIIQKMNSNLFGKGKEKILECFYINRSKELYFSEILRETKLTQNTTLKHLKNLQENNLVISTKKIGNTFYKINPKNPQIYSIFSYFDFKKLNKLPSERKRAIIEFLEKIKDEETVVLILDSDVNQLVVEQRKMFFNIINSNCKRPIIIKRKYSCETVEEFQLFAATDIALLMTDGLGDGIWLEAEGVHSQIIEKTSFDILHLF